MLLWSVWNFLPMLGNDNNILGLVKWQFTEEIRREFNLSVVKAQSANTRNAFIVG